MKNSTNKSYLVKTCQKGFTLIELMIALVLGAIVIGAIYSTYIVQQRSYTVQETVAEMQQNIRAAMMVMARDIRMAGYDPDGTGNFSITAASSDRLRFTVDLNENGSVDGNETITYGFSTANDGNADGIADAGSAPLGKCTVFPIGPPGFQPIAGNIQAIEFQYLDVAGAVTATTADIRAVQVSILARASRPDRRFTNTMTYTTASGATWGSPYNDNFRRRLLITTIQCRNMGL